MNLNAATKLIVDLRHTKSTIYDRLLESQMTLMRVHLSDEEKLLALRSMQQGLNELRELDRDFLEVESQLAYVDGKMRNLNLLTQEIVRGTAELERVKL